MSDGESHILSYWGKSLQVLTVTSAASIGLDSLQVSVGSAADIYHRSIIQVD